MAHFVHGNAFIDGHRSAIIIKWYKNYFPCSSALFFQDFHYCGYTGTTVRFCRCRCSTIAARVDGSRLSSSTSLPSAILDGQE